MSARSSRRDFLRRAAVAGAGFWVSGLPAVGRTNSPSEKLNIGFIGAGGRGSHNIESLADQNIVSLCDIDEHRIRKPARDNPGAKVYSDFRKMLEQQKDLDAVVVSTPDHTHAVAALTAMRLGKHVYCEKPLAHDIAEARLLRDEAARCKVATQMGNQYTATDQFRRAVELIQDGAVGDVREAHVWTDRPGKRWEQGLPTPTERSPVPPGIDWDLWLGPAPERPYHRAYHPFKWRGWVEFGTGAIGDMACHTANLAYTALKLGAPAAAEAKTSGPCGDSFPAWSAITYEFPSRGDRSAVRLVWYDGGQQPPAEVIALVKLPPGEKLPVSGSILIGSKGVFYSPGDYGADANAIIRSDGGREEVKGPPQRLPASPGHHAEWVLACKGVPAAMSDFSRSAPFVEAMLLGVVALRAGKRVEWDPTTMTVVNVPEANAFVRRTNRAGW